MSPTTRCCLGVQPVHSSLRLSQPPGVFVVLRPILRVNPVGSPPSLYVGLRVFTFGRFTGNRYEVSDEAALDSMIMRTLIFSQVFCHPVCQCQRIPILPPTTGLGCSESAAAASLTIKYTTILWTDRVCVAPHQTTVASSRTVQ